MTDYRKIAGCIRLAADRLKRDNDLGERNAMKPRNAEDLATHFRPQDEADFAWLEAHGYADQVQRMRKKMNEGPRYPCSRHGFRESVAPVALRWCAQCKADAEARYGTGAPLANPSSERLSENQNWLGRGMPGAWRNL